MRCLISISVLALTLMIFLCTSCLSLDGLTAAAERNQNSPSMEEAKDSGIQASENLEAVTGDDATLSEPNKLKAIAIAQDHGSVNTVIISTDADAPQEKAEAGDSILKRLGGALKTKWNTFSKIFKGEGP